MAGAAAVGEASEVAQMHVRRAFVANSQRAAAFGLVSS